LVPELDGPIYKGIFSDNCILLSASDFPIMINHVPELDGPIYKGIFSDICLLLSASNFPIMIIRAQIAWSF
jgi:hypothetical protein